MSRKKDQNEIYSDSDDSSVIFVEEVDRSTLKRRKVSQKMGCSETIAANLSPIVVLSDVQRTVPECQKEIVRKTIVPSIEEKEPSTEEDEEIDYKLDQVSFLRLFNLTPRASNNSQCSLEKPVVLNGNNGRKKCNLNDMLRQYSISSKIGQKLIIDRYPVSNLLESAVKNEKFCYFSRRKFVIFEKEHSGPNYDITFTPKNETHCHKYCFTKKQRREKMTTFDTGLNQKSLRLLRQCKTAIVKLRRLKNEEIIHWTSRNSSSKVKSVDVTEPKGIIDKRQQLTVLDHINGASYDSNYILNKYLSSVPNTVLKTERKKRPVVKLDKLESSSILTTTNNTAAEVPSQSQNKRSVLKSSVRETVKKLEHEKQAESDSDSEVEFLGYKTNNMTITKRVESSPSSINNGVTFPILLLNKIPGKLDSSTENINRNDQIMLHCKICNYKQECDYKKMNDGIQQHMAVYHCGWKKVIVVHKMELQKSNSRFKLVVEAYADDPVLW